jgi:hypothetical protein
VTDATETIRLPFLNFRRLKLVTMRVSRVAKVFLVLFVAVLNGCGKSPEFVAKEEPWRADDERACLASGLVADNRFIHARSALGGPSVCGALRPFDMTAAAAGRVSLQPSALLRCPMIPAVEHWVQQVVEPAARHYFRVPLAQLKVAASYACRPINHQSGARLSEHGHANALDVSAFHLADGRVITVKNGWYGGPEERAFLRAVHSGACQTFTTVLGPHADAFHRDHFHMDLARHGSRGDIRICK